MSDVSTFDSTKLPIQTILQEIRDGKTQLPDFQRTWVWDDDRIKSLLASVSMAFPIGALMTLVEWRRGGTFQAEVGRRNGPRACGCQPRDVDS